MPNKHRPQLGDASTDLGWLHSLLSAWRGFARRRTTVSPNALLAGLYSLWAIRSRRTRPSKPRRGEIKAFVMEALTRIDHYEDRITRRPVDPDAVGARSVGLSYRQIREEIRARYPGIRISMMTVRSYARDAKEQGEPLPYRRPYSVRRRKVGMRN